MPERSKLVSHRLRGFGRYENCGSALRRACRSDVPLLEVDTRVAADGRIFVHHNPRGRYHLSARPDFSRMDGAALRRVRYPSGEPLLELDECLRIFTDRRDRHQRLCIDMKDVGFERQHLQLAERYGVAERICWMSWVPWSLVQLHRLNAPGPLILAHCNLARFGAAGRWLEAAFARSTVRVARLVLRGVALQDAAIAGFDHGFQHGLVCAQVPRSIHGLLRDSGGGVCIHRTLLHQQLIDDCRAAGLALWVFRVRTAAGFHRMARHPGISAVFCDDAPSVLRAATTRPTGAPALALPRLQQRGDALLA
jgi:glycerophosphoryl diester phosphodiesterase